MAVEFTYRSRESWADPFDDYRALRDSDPVHEVGEGEFWVLSRFDDVFAAARDTETFSSANGLTTAPDDMASFDDKARPIVMMDPPEHTAMRRLVSRPMTPRQVAPVEDHVRAFVTEKLDAVADAGEVDIVQFTSLADERPIGVVNSHERHAGGYRLQSRLLRLAGPLRPRFLFGGVLEVPDEFGGL